MLERARFQNYKSLGDTSLTLAPFTLLVGENASGKTSVLQAIHDVVALVAEGATPEAVLRDERAPSRLRRLGAAGEVQLEVGGTSWDFSVSVTEPPARSRPTLTLDGQKTPTGDWTEPNVRGLMMPRLRKLGLGSAALVRLDARVAARPHAAHDENQRLASDGAGLASVIQRLQLARDGRLEQLEQHLNAVVPVVTRLRAMQHKVRGRSVSEVTIDGHSRLFERDDEQIGARVEAEIGGQWIPADLLSEGTVLTLALLTVLVDEAPRVLLIDDIDRGLHPTAQARLINVIRRIQAARAEAGEPVQVIASTHSPYLVDAFQAGEVRVVHLVDGATQVRSLADHPEWQRSRGTLGTGEFWSSVGEAWVKP